MLRDAKTASVSLCLNMQFRVAKFLDAVISDVGCRISYVRDGRSDAHQGRRGAIIRGLRTC